MKDVSSFSSSISIISAVSFWQQGRRVFGVCCYHLGLSKSLLHRLLAFCPPPSSIMMYIYIYIYVEECNGGGHTANSFLLDSLCKTHLMSWLEIDHEKGNIYI